MIKTSIFTKSFGCGFGYIFLLLSVVSLSVLAGCIEKKTDSEAAQIPFEMWPADQVLKADELAKVFSDPNSQRPIVLHVGYQIQYESGHIPGARHTGPASKDEGIDGLKREAQNIPRESEIVLYCGCCPWKNCPNVRPAFMTMKEMGFKNVKALYIPNNFQQDWSNNGFPVEKEPSH